MRTCEMTLTRYPFGCCIVAATTITTTHESNTEKQNNENETDCESSSHFDHTSDWLSHKVEKKIRKNR
jgi:hypothetical protein